MKCLIVDDEALARDVLETYIEKLSHLQLVAQCSNALQAFAALNKHTVDLMFLDIKMPELSGLELIKTLKSPPKIIITTAFHQHALEGYELDVVDYLLKPFSFERFAKAVEKAGAREQKSESKISEDSFSFFVKSDRKMVQIHAAEIIYIEGLKNYLCIYTTHQKVIVHSTLSHLELQLKAFPPIQRIHKSYLVNKNFIVEIDNQLVILSNKQELPIGSSYKDDFFKDMRIF